jgi:hypothetical protein
VIRLLEEPALIHQELDRRLEAARTSDPTAKREQSLQRELTHVGKGIERLLTAYQEGLLSLEQLRDRMPALRHRQQTLSAELQAITDQTNDRVAFLRLAETLTAFLARLRSAAETLSVIERQKIVRLLVKDVLVGEDIITIRHSIPIPSGLPQNGGSDGPNGQNYLLCKRSDQPTLARIKCLGIEAGQSFDPAKVDPIIRQALQTAPSAAQRAIIAEWPKVGRTANGWVMNTDSGVYGANYLKRAAVAMFEIGMNLPEDSIYPDTAATPLDGHNNYIMHFAKGALPPVDEFWSVTVYDLQGFTVPNSTDRYALGDRSNLKPNTDGSVDIYLQNKSPGADKESNWLPVPAQPFSLHARLYSPRPAAIDGTWAMPAVVKTK